MIGPFEIPLCHLLPQARQHLADTLNCIDLL